MKRSVLLIMLLALTLFADSGENASSAREGRSATKYPIVLVHGFGPRDIMFGFIDSFGRITKSLRDDGAIVYHGGTDALGNIESNAYLLKERIELIQAETGAEKVNILAHSKGGLDARYMITMLDMADSVASLTTFSTPHRGTSAVPFRIADIRSNNTAEEVEQMESVANQIGTLMGDRYPDILRAAEQLGPVYMAGFNVLVTNMPGVYYQSFAAALRSIEGAGSFEDSYKIIMSNQGENDGMVAVSSAKWGRFRMVINGAEGTPGLRHPDMVDQRRRTVSGVNVPRVWVLVVRELKEMGY